MKNATLTLNKSGCGSYNKLNVDNTLKGKALTLTEDDRMSDSGETYEAKAIDDNGTEYLVFWETSEEPGNLKTRERGNTVIFINE